MRRGTLGVTVAVGLWWTVVAVFDVAPLFLPAPPDIISAFGRHGGYLLHETWVTLGHTLAGLAAATITGLATATLLAASQRLREAGLPLLVALQNVPKVALAPLLVVWLGFNTTPKIVLVALLSFFPILLSTLAGLRATPAELIDLTRSLQASRWHTFTKVRLPAAGPHIFTGLKVATSLALIAAVVAQITTPNSGLGAVIVRAGQTADTPLAFAAITLLAATGITLFYTVTGIERLLLPWARATTA